jgi:hypothetical protein
MIGIEAFDKHAVQRSLDVVVGSGRNLGLDPDAEAALSDSLDALDLRRLDHMVGQRRW